MGIIAAIIGSFARLIADRLSYYLAIKALAIAIMMILLPYVLKSVILWLVNSVLEYAMSAMPAGSSISSTVLSITGFGAYLVNQTYIVQAFLVVLSALITRMVLNFVPFVK